MVCLAAGSLASTAAEDSPMGLEGSESPDRPVKRSRQLTEQQQGVSTLADLCYVQLRDGSMDVQSLYRLPFEQLVEVLQKMHQDYKTESQHSKALEEQNQALAVQQENHYVVEPPIVQDRVEEDVWEAKELAIGKWEAGRGLQTSSYGGRNLAWQISTQSFVWTSEYRLCNGWGHSHFRPTAEMMSSALLLYRLLSLFPEQLNVMDHIDGYKCVWNVCLKHKKSQLELAFGERKGAAHIWPSTVPLEGKARAPCKDFLDDVQELVNILFSPTCPHTYDGTVAGSVA